VTDKVKEIFTAWKISFNPSEEQSILAAKRLEVCLDCRHNLKTMIGINVCVECGCPISKKVFSKQSNPCPEKKWDF
jgi:hypothetical protein